MHGLLASPALANVRNGSRIPRAAACSNVDTQMFVQPELSLGPAAGRACWVKLLVSAWSVTGVD